MKNIGKYEILERIGSGGFGTVYKGRDPFLKRTVAIKTCTSDEEEYRRRFYREAEIFGSLQHPNITTVHDFGIHEDVPYLVQEFLDGEDLTAIIKRADPNVPIELRLSYLVQIARALEHAHSLGVVHRDIKPGNIRRLDDGTIKVMDFGIAKLVHLETQLTRTGAMVGTASYLSPEQISEEELDHRCDIFSFGVVAYELLTYHRPFAGSTISSLVYEILHKNPRPIVMVWPECPEELADLVMGCLRRKKEDRPPDFRKILARLLSMLGTEDSQSAILFPEQTLAFTPEDSAELVKSSAVRAASSASQQPPTSRSFLPASRSALVTMVAGIILAILVLVAFSAWRIGRGGDNDTAVVAESVTETTEPVDAGAVATEALASPEDIIPAPAAPTERAEQAPAPTKEQTAPPQAESSSPAPTVIRPIAEPAEEPSSSRNFETTAPDSGLIAARSRTVQVVDDESDTPVAESDPPAVTVAPTPPPADQTAAVLEAIRRYEEAFENLDAAAIQRAWPSLEAQQLQALKRGLSNYQWLEMDVEICEVSVDGIAATASCQVRRVIKPKAGARQTDQRQTTFHLRREGERWVIDRL